MYSAYISLLVLTYLEEKNMYYFLYDVCIRQRRETLSLSGVCLGKSFQCASDRGGKRCPCQGYVLANPFSGDKEREYKQEQEKRTRQKEGINNRRKKGKR